MSKKAYVEFLTKVNTDNAVKQAFNTVLKGKDDVPLMELDHSISQLGQQYGYYFTSQEAKEIEEEMENWQQNGEEGELSDEVLELVAGGICTRTNPRGC